MNPKLPQFSTYCNYKSDNYGAHALRFDIGGLTVWFSYKTPIAFCKSGTTVVRQNQWGPTTGKHLNAIDGGNKAARIPGPDFEAQLIAALT